MATGWTWEYVWENMTLQRLGVLNKIWKRCPPTNVALARLSMMVAAGLGIKDTAPPMRSAATPAFATPPEFEE